MDPTGGDPLHALPSSNTRLLSPPLLTIDSTPIHYVGLILSVAFSATLLRGQVGEGQALNIVNNDTLQPSVHHGRPPDNILPYMHHYQHCMLLPFPRHVLVFCQPTFSTLPYRGTARRRQPRLRANTRTGRRVLNCYGNVTSAG